MATARALDVLLGATTASPPRTGTATAPGNGNGNGPRNGPGNASPARALSTAAFMGAHTLAVTAVSRREAQGGAPAVPLAALGAVAAIAAGVSSQRRRSTPMTLAATAAYVGTAVRPLAHAALNPSPPLLQRAVGGGIRAMIPSRRRSPHGPPRSPARRPHQVAGHPAPRRPATRRETAAAPRTRWPCSR